VTAGLAVVTWALGVWSLPDNGARRSLDAMTPKQAQEHSHGNALAPPPLGNPPCILPRAADIPLDPRDRPACWRPSARRRSVACSRLVTILSLPAAHRGIVPGVTLLRPFIRVAVRNPHPCGVVREHPRKPSRPDQDIRVVRVAPVGRRRERGASEEDEICSGLAVGVASGAATLVAQLRAGQQPFIDAFVDGDMSVFDAHPSTNSS
jgi:hypothetical protein